jgi:lipopolysaccharide/colanic/teichoic acid biosynthesis glycosyltransferase
MSAGITNCTLPRAHSTAFTAKSSGESGVQPSRYFRWKGLLDRFAALVLIVPGLPLIGLLVLLIRLTSRGPGIYRQVRVGHHGKSYVMYKLRSMRLDAESGTGAVWAKNGDPRVTWLGYWLRKLHLDELPQLFNVLKGEMSLIGPRPERPEFVKLLGREIPGYLERLVVLPGVTGLAQINLPADRDLDDVRRKIVLDVEYIQTGSLVFDLRIFLCTLLRIVGVRGELAMRWMGLQRTVALPSISAGLDETIHDLSTDKTVAFEAPNDSESVHCASDHSTSRPINVSHEKAIDVSFAGAQSR